MIVWQAKNGSINLGPLSESYCGICKVMRPFNIVLFYRYSGLYWVMNRISARQYRAVCSVCGNGAQVDTEKTEAKLKENNVKAKFPFMQQYGLALFLTSILGSVILAGIIGSSVQH